MCRRHAFIQHPPPAPLPADRRRITPPRAMRVGNRETHSSASVEPGSGRYPKTPCRRPFESDAKCMGGLPRPLQPRLEGVTCRPNAAPELRGEWAWGHSMICRPVRAPEDQLINLIGDPCPLSHLQIHVSYQIWHASNLDDKKAKNNLSLVCHLPPRRYPCGHTEERQEEGMVKANRSK